MLVFKWHVDDTYGGTFGENIRRDMRHYASRCCRDIVRSVYRSASLLKQLTYSWSQGTKGSLLQCES